MPADRLFSSKENVKRYRQSENESLGVRADRTKSTHTSRSSRGLVLHRKKTGDPATDHLKLRIDHLLPLFLNTLDEEARAYAVQHLTVCPCLTPVG
jgi:hypothetical protein